LQSAAIGRYGTTQSVNEFVIAQSDPRSGMWAMKSYKTPTVFNPDAYKIKGMSLKEEIKGGAKSKEPKIKFYVKPLKWTDDNKSCNY
jgi:hypothetical protein